VSLMFGTAFGLAVEIKYPAAGCTDEACWPTCDMALADRDYEGWPDLGVMRWAPGLPVLRFGGAQ
jgi:hypothetical protein